MYYVTAPRIVQNARPYPVSVTIQNASSPVAISIQLVEKFTPFYRYGAMQEVDEVEKENVLAIVNGTVAPRTTQKFILPVRKLFHFLTKILKISACVFYIICILHVMLLPRHYHKIIFHQVPAVGKDFGDRWRGNSNRVLRITGRDSSGKSFNDESNQINIEKKNNLIFIQTDKPLYKLGDSVKFRVIVVDLSLKPVRAPLDIKIYVSHTILIIY